MSKKAKNLLANGKNNITARANMLGDVQSRVANNTSATNLNAISTPTRPDISRPVTNLNLQKAQQPVQTKLDNLNTQTGVITGNNPAFVNGQLRPHSTNQVLNDATGRFIGFQNPTPAVQNTTITATGPEGKSFGKLSNGGYMYVPSDEQTARINNANVEANYTRKVTALDDLQQDIYKLKRTLTESEIRNYYPELNDNIDDVMKLQKEIKPILAKGNMVTTEWLEQRYSQLLSKDTKNLEEVKQKSEKSNEDYQAAKSTLDRVLKGNWDGLSIDGLKKLRDLDILVQTTEEAKKKRVVGEANDFEIMAYLIKNNPELQKVWDEMNSLEYTEKDKAILGTKDANKIAKNYFSDLDFIGNTISDIIGKEDTRANYDQIETGIRAKEALAEDYWGETWKNIKVKSSAVGDNIEKAIYKADKDLDYYATKLENYVGDSLQFITKPLVEKIIGKDLTDAEYDDLLKRKREKETARHEVDKQKVEDYFDIVNNAYQKKVDENLNPDIENFVNNRSMTNMLLQGDVGAFMYKGAGEAAQNAEQPLIIAVSTLNPAAGFALMAADSFSRESTEAYEELRKAGADYDQATQGGYTVGLLSSLVEVGLENVLGGVETTTSNVLREIFMKDFSKRATEMVAKKGLADILLHGVGTQLWSSLEEGLEEVFQQMIHNNEIRKYNIDQDLWEGVIEAFEGGFYNPMNFLAGGGDIMSEINKNSDYLKNQAYQGAYNAGKTTRNVVDTVKNTFTRNNKQNVIENVNNQVNTNQTTDNQVTDNQTENNIGKTENKGVVDKITDRGAEKLTSTATAQDKLYKAQEPRMNVLSNKKNLERRRANSDRANELIVENGYKPTNTAERLEAHQATLNKLWKVIKDQVNQGKDIIVDQSSIIEALTKYIQEKKDLNIAGIESDIKALEKELNAFKKAQRKGSTDLPILENKKQVYNDIVDWKGQEASEVYKGGIRLITAEIGKIEDALISEIPGEFSKQKRDVGALLDTYEDVFKADMKNQRSKGLGIAETYSRIEGVGDIIEGVLGVFKGEGTKVLKGAGKILLGKSLAKAKNVDFLIKTGFDELSKEMKSKKKGGNITDNNNTTPPTTPTTPTTPIDNTENKVTENKPITPNKPKNKVTSKKSTKSVDKKGTNDYNATNQKETTSDSRVVVGQEEKKLKSPFVIDKNGKGYFKTADGKLKESKAKEYNKFQTKKILSLKGVDEKYIKSLNELIEADTKDVPAIIGNLKKARIDEDVLARWKLLKHIHEEHGVFPVENLLATLADPDAIIENVEVLNTKTGELEHEADLINVLKKIPNTDNFYIVGIRKLEDGRYGTTFFEVGNKTFNEWLQKGNIIFEKQQNKVTGGKNAVTNKKTESNKQTKAPKDMTAEERQQYNKETKARIVENKKQVVEKSHTKLQNRLAEAGDNTNLSEEQLDKIGNDARQLGDDIYEVEKRGGQVPAEMKTALKSTYDLMERNGVDLRYAEEGKVYTDVDNLYDETEGIEKIYEMSPEVEAYYNEKGYYPSNAQYEIKQSIAPATTKETNSGISYLSRGSAVVYVSMPKATDAKNVVTKNSKVTEKKVGVRETPKTETKQEENQTKKFTYDEYEEVMNKIWEVEKEINERLDKQMEQERAEKMKRFKELDNNENTDRSDGSEIAKLAGELNNLTNKYDRLKEEELKKQVPELLKKKEELRDAFGRDWKAVLDNRFAEIEKPFNELRDRYRLKLKEELGLGDDVVYDEKFYDSLTPEQKKIADRLNKEYVDEYEGLRLKTAGEGVETKEESKSKVTDTGKNKVTNPTKSKETSLFNENEVEKGNESEGLNPDALPLSDYREIQRLNDGYSLTSLSSALSKESLKDYMANKIANEKIGVKPDFDDNEAWDKLPEDFEDDWGAVATDIEEMYDAYEEYLDMENGGDTFDENTLKNTLESANDYANRQFPGKTAKEVIDQYTPEYESDLKIYNRLIKKYPGVFANGKIDLTGAEGKARREFSNQVDELAKDRYETDEWDMDYQELAELENITPQITDAEMPEEEGIKNKVTSKKTESKPKNLVTSKTAENTNTEVNTEFETLPADVSIQKEAKETGPKRIAPDRVPRQQLTFEEGVNKINDNLKTIAEYMKLRSEFYTAGNYNDSDMKHRLNTLEKDVQQILYGGKGFQFKSSKSKEFTDLWKNIKDNIDNSKGLDEVGKTFYISKVKKDISKGYVYPQKVLDKIPGAKKAINDRERYQKGLDTSFSAKDERIDYSEKDKIGAGIKSQDGKQVTKEQKDNIVKGVMDFQKVFGINMKKIAEDLGFVYVDLHGGAVFLSQAVGMYRRTFNKDGTVKNSSVSVGGSEVIRWKDKKTGERKTEQVNTTMSHELGHVVDHLVEDGLFGWQDMAEIRPRYKHDLAYGRAYAKYLDRDTEVVARAFEQYMDVAKGGNLYYDQVGYWSKSDFENYVKPIVEKNIKNKLGDWYIDPNTIKYQKVTSNAKNKITSKQEVKSQPEITKKQLEQLADTMKKTGLASDVMYHDSLKDFTNYVNGTVDTPRLQRVRHGSQNSFEKFDNSYMGDGQGTQHHGYGFYVTKNKNIAKSYAELRDPKTRNLYEIEIPDSIETNTPTGKNYLEEAGKLTKKQRNMFRDAIKDLDDSKKEHLGGKIMAETIPEWIQGDNGWYLYKHISNVLGGDKNASKFLEDMGYDGIHYVGKEDGNAYVIFNDDTLDITNHIQYLRDNNGDIAGAVTPDGVVHLILPNLRADTVAHEFSHLLRSYAKQNNSDLFNAINKIAQEAPQELKDYVKRTYGDLSEDAFLDEVFAWRQGQYSGIKSAQTWYERMWNAIKELWNSVKSKFGKQYADLSVFDAYEKMSSEELMNKVDSLLKGGKEIGQGKGSETRYERTEGNLNDLKREYYRVISPNYEISSWDDANLHGALDYMLDKKGIENTGKSILRKFRALNSKLPKIKNGDDITNLSPIDQFGYDLKDKIIETYIKKKNIIVKDRDNRNKGDGAYPNHTYVLMEIGNYTAKPHISEFLYTKLKEEGYIR